MRAALTASLGVCGLAACAFLAPRAQPLPDGSYRIACDGPLSKCLDAFDDICEWHGYDVIAASENRRRSDLREVPSVTVASEARVRCKLGEPLLGGKPSPPATPAPPAGPPPAAPTAPTAAPAAPSSVPPLPPGPPGPGPVDGAGLPAGPSSTAEPCRGGPGGDPRPGCRELGMLSNSVSAPTIPAPGADAVTSNRGARGAAPASSAAPFEGWPAGSSPREVGARLVKNYLARPLSLTAPVHYAEACTWYGALTTAKLLGDAALEAALEERYLPILTPAGAAVVPPRAHVDDRVFGIVPLEIAMHGAGLAYLSRGKQLADSQWATTTADGITTEARYWVDDMYMIPALQVQAFRATGDGRYLDRAARAMAAYLDKLQQPNGLFFHTATSPRHWGRGNGWFAAGMTELLRALPGTHPQRGRIMAGYRRMMAALLAHQTASGMWRQLIDEESARNWPETSSTGMFAFAMVTGVKNGWLPADSYGPAARRAWLALVQHLDADGNIREVSAGTGEAASSGGGTSPETQIRYYLDRPRVVGDLHGQAPLLWTASALLR